MIRRGGVVRFRVRGEKEMGGRRDGWCGVRYGREDVLLRLNFI
jgi:hypothetical protein